MNYIRNSLNKSLLIVFVLCFCLSKANAQDITQLDDNLLIGEWIYVKTIDKNNAEVDYIIQDYKRADGKEIKIKANGPDIIINKDQTYVKKFTEEKSDVGTWKLISDNEIEFEMNIDKNSNQGKMIAQTQDMFGKEWRTDSEGNFLDTSIDKILSFSKDEMKIEYEKNYTLVYMKK